MNPNVEFQWGAATDIGQVRTINQDNLLATGKLFVVADGMGGHRGGEVASEIAVERFGELSEQTVTGVVEGVRSANVAIFERGAADAGLFGMGTTLCALVPVRRATGDEALAVVNVGDSRVYRFADGELEQVTEDHSVVEELVRDGILTPEEADHHPQRNILTRALGIELNLLVDTWLLPPRAGDRFLLCSDGLFNEVPNDVIAATLANLPDPVEAADELVRLANEHGSRDNVTVVVADVASGTDGEVAELPIPPTVAQITELGVSFDVDPDPYHEPTEPHPVVPPPRRSRRWPWSRN